MGSNFNDEALAELKKISRLLALSYVQDLDVGPAAVKLNQAGFGPTEIVNILGAPKGTVSSALTRAKRSEGPPKKAAKKAK